MTMFDTSPLEGLTADELYELRAELIAHMRHPAIIAKPSLHREAGMQLALIALESDKRWRAVWWHRDNEKLSNTLYSVLKGKG